MIEIKAQEIAEAIASVPPQDRLLLIDATFDAIVAHPLINTLEFQNQLETQGVQTNQAGGICKRKKP